MKVVDYKDTCFLSILTRKRKFNMLEKRLQRCSSLAEQKSVLREFYKDTTFKRDDFLARQDTLQNKRAVGLKEIVFIYKDFLIAIISSLFTIYWDKIIIEGSELTIVFPKLKLWTFTFIGIIVVAWLSASMDKINHIRKDISLQEIFDYELHLIQSVLACNSEEIDYDDLIESIL